MQSIGYLALAHGGQTSTSSRTTLKHSLMDLLRPNHDVEGADLSCGTFAGTQALFSAVDWVFANGQLDGRSVLSAPGRPSGREAVVVISDMGEQGVGAGAVAMLVGSEAPLVLERGLRAVYSANGLDGGTEADPPAEGRAYLDALEHCLHLYRHKSEAQAKRKASC